MIPLPVERRRSRRSTVMLTATIDEADGQRLMKVMNVSSGGALVLGHALPHGRSVILRRGSNDVPSYVAWTSGDESGLEFERAVDVQSVLRTITKPNPVVQLAHRRPRLK